MVTNRAIGKGRREVITKLRANEAKRSQILKEVNRINNEVAREVAKKTVTTTQPSTTKSSLDVVMGMKAPKYDIPALKHFDVDTAKEIMNKYFKDLERLDFEIKPLKQAKAIGDVFITAVAKTMESNKPSGKKAKLEQAKLNGSKFKTVAIKDQGEAGRRAQAMAQPDITPMNVETRDSLHRGLVGMADRVQAPVWMQDKIVLMDPDKLKEIYYENPQFFEVVFDYEDITFDEHFGGWLVGGYEMERIENFIRMYERRYGEI